MKICQDISQEMAKIQNVIDQFKDLAEKVAKAGIKEEMDKLQSEFARLKVVNFAEYEKQQQKLKALSMNFQKELGFEEGIEANVDLNGYLIKLNFTQSKINFSETNLSETKIIKLSFNGTRETKILKTEYLPKNLQKLDVANSKIDLFENDLSKTKITELMFGNKVTKTLKTEFLPKNLEKLNISFSEIDLSETNLSETKITELNFNENTGTKTLNFNYLPLTLKTIRIRDSLLLKENPNIVQELQAFFKQRNQKVEIIK